MSDSLDAHYQIVLDALTDSDLVIFLGAGANLCGRPADLKGWERGRYLPSGGELSAYLADKFHYPTKNANDRQDLLRVSQYADAVRGSGPLYKSLREIFNIDYPPTPLHHLLAELPSILKRKGYPAHLFIVTTNYDDVLEHTFDAVGEPYDLVTYVAEGTYEERGKFLHWPPGSNSKPRLIDDPNQDIDIKLAEHTVVLKIHGAVNRLDDTRDSYVITEDNYIDYLTHTDISSLVPVSLSAKLKRSNFLFLGYSLRDWNLRAILRRIWRAQIENRSFKSWAVQLNPDELDEKFWENRHVEIINADLGVYIGKLSELIRRPEFAGGGA